MTVEIQTIGGGPYEGDGVTTTFDYDGALGSAAHLKVYFTGTDGVTELLTNGIDYTATIGDEDGTVSYPKAGSGRATLAVDEYLVIEPGLPYTQERDLVGQGGYYPEVQEGALDYLTLCIQQLRNEVARSAKAIAGSPLQSGITIQAPGAGRLLMWSQTEPDQIVLGPLSSSVIGHTAVESVVDTYADARALDGLLLADGDMVLVNGNNAVGDGGTGAFYWVSTNNEDDNNGTILKLDGWVGAGRLVRGYASTVKLEWFNPDMTGATDESTLMDTVFALGHSETVIPAGILEAQCEMPSYHILRGAGCSHYEVGHNGATVLRRPAAKGAALRVVDIKGYTVQDLDIDGNGSRALNDSKAGIRGARSSYGVFFRVKVTDCDWGYYGDTGTNLCGVTTFLECVFRENNVGIRNFRDTIVSQCTISANYEHGIYTLGSNSAIVNSYIEWNRNQDSLVNGVAGSSNGIYLDGNSSEILIANNRFDRNAGHSIFVGNGAKDILIGSGNKFSGCAWGHDLDWFNRYSIFCNGTVDGLIVAAGNLVEPRGKPPSSNEGPVCPLGFLQAGTSKHVAVGQQQISKINPIDLNDDQLAFFPSATGGEYYLDYVSPYTGTLTSPPIVLPPLISNGYLADQFFVSYAHDGTYPVAAKELVEGVVGALTNDQFGWGDNDTLGFDTLYVRVADSDAPPNVINPSDGNTIVKAYYNMQPIDLEDVTDVETPNFRDRVTRKTVAFGATEKYRLKTRTRAYGASVRYLTVRLFGWQETSSDQACYDFSVVLDRASATAGAVVVREGAVAARNAGGGTFTFGWATTGTDDLQVAVTSDLMGDEITVSVYNADGSRDAYIDVEVLP